MTDLTARLIVQLIDKVSGPAAKAGGALKGIEGELANLKNLQDKFSATRDLFKNYTASNRTMRDAQKNVADLAKQLREAKIQVEQFANYKIKKGDILGPALTEGRNKVKELERAFKSAVREVKGSTSAFREQGTAIRNAFSNVGVKNLQQFIGSEKRLKSAVELANKALKDQQNLQDRRGPKPSNRNTRTPPARSWRDRAVTGGQVVAGAAGFSVVQGVRDSVGFLYDWEKEANRYNAQGGGTPQERMEAQAYANKLGESGKITPYKALGVQTEVMKAGYSGAQSRGITGASADLALYGGVDPLYAQEIITSGISQFKLPRSNAEETKKSAERIADVVAYTAAKTQSDVNDVGNVFKYIGPLASVLGLTPEHVAALYTQQARVGVKGPEGGTALRDMLVKMIKPTLDGQSVLAEHGIKMSEFVTSQGPLDGDGFVSGAERKFGKLKKGTSGKINAWIKSNPDATMEEQIAFLQAELEKGTSAKGPQDKKETSKYAGAFVNSSVESLDYDKLMTTLIDAGLTPTEVARLFTGKHVARDLPIFKDGKYQYDLNALQTDAQGSAAKQAELQQQGLPGAFSKFVSSVQTAAVDLDKLSGITRILANGLSSATDLLQRATGKKPLVDKYPDGSFGIPGMFQVKDRPPTPTGEGFWNTLKSYIPSVSIQNGKVGEGTPMPNVRTNLTGPNAELDRFSSKLSEIGARDVAPRLTLLGVENSIVLMEKLISLINYANSTTVSPPGSHAAHADINGGGGRGW